MSDDIYPVMIILREHLKANVDIPPHPAYSGFVRVTINPDGELMYKAISRKDLYKVPEDPDGCSD